MPPALGAAIARRVPNQVPPAHCSFCLLPVRPRALATACLIPSTLQALRTGERRAAAAAAAPGTAAAPLRARRSSCSPTCAISGIAAVSCALHERRERGREQQGRQEGPRLSLHACETAGWRGQALHGLLKCSLTATVPAPCAPVSPAEPALMRRSPQLVCPCAAQAATSKTHGTCLAQPCCPVPASAPCLVPCPGPPLVCSALRLLCHCAPSHHACRGVTSCYTAGSMCCRCAAADTSHLSRDLLGSGACRVGARGSTTAYESALRSTDGTGQQASVALPLAATGALLPWLALGRCCCCWKGQSPPACRWPAHASPH